MANKQASTVLKKNAKGYSYKYTDLAAIHEYIEECGLSYFQEIERQDSDDYIVTHILDAAGQELRSVRGARLVNATLNGVNNPAQEQGSAITYARRYSLLMAFGLATEDDDAQSLSQTKTSQTNRFDFATVHKQLKEAKTGEDWKRVYATIPENKRKWFAGDKKDAEKKFSPASEQEEEYYNEELGLPRGAGDPDTYGYPGEDSDESS